MATPDPSGLGRTYRERADGGPLPPMSRDLSEALRLAEDAARGMGHGYVGTGHLLSGMLAQGRGEEGGFGGCAGVVLARHGLEAADVRAAIRHAPCHPACRDAVGLPWGRALRSVLDRAARMAHGVGHGGTGTRAALLSLLEEKGSVGRLALEAAGVSRQALGQELAWHFRPDGQDAPQPPAVDALAQSALGQAEDLLAAGDAALERVPRRLGAWPDLRAAAERHREEGLRLMRLVRATRSAVEAVADALDGDGLRHSAREAAVQAAGPPFARSLREAVARLRSGSASVYTPAYGTLMPGDMRRLTQLLWQQEHDMALAELAERPDGGPLGVPDEGAGECCRSGPATHQHPYAEDMF